MLRFPLQRGVLWWRVLLCLLAVLVHLVLFGELLHGIHGVNLLFLGLFLLIQIRKGLLEHYAVDILPLILVKLFVCMLSRLVARSNLLHLGQGLHGLVSKDDLFISLASVARELANLGAFWVSLEAWIPLKGHLDVPQRVIEEELLVSDWGMLLIDEVEGLEWTIGSSKAAASIIWECVDHIFTMFNSSAIGVAQLDGFFLNFRDLPLQRALYLIRLVLGFVLFELLLVAVYVVIFFISIVLKLEGWG